jgi:hypothetical protein
MPRRWANRLAPPPKRSASAALAPAGSVAAEHPAAAALLRWLVAQAHSYLQLYDALAAWAVAIRHRITPRLVIPWSPRKLNWHKLWTFALDKIWTRRVELCDALHQACLGALSNLATMMRTAKKLRAPLLNTFGGRLHTVLLDWAHVEHRRCLVEQVVFARWREQMYWQATFKYEVNPRTRMRAVQREDFVQLAWLRALRGVYDGLREKRTRGYDILGLVLTRARQNAAAHWHTIQKLQRVDSMDF